MGKSIRSKIKKRLRTAKRQRVDAMIIKPREAEHYDQLQKVIDGRAVTLARPPNAFKYPDAPGAVFAQHEVMKPVDFRAQNLPMAGYAFRGNRRKYTDEEEKYMKDIALNQHPKMEVLAGGGAILAKTGTRVSIREAELEATKTRNPEAAAIAEAGPSRAASAVAAAVAEDDMEMRDAAPAPMPQSNGEEQEEAASASAAAAVPVPGNEADTSRRPLVKDTRRAQRNRPRADAVKKKGKAKAHAKAEAKTSSKADVKPASVANASQASPAAAPAAPAAAAAAAAPAAMKVESSVAAATPAAAQGTSPKKKKGKAKKASKASAAGEAEQMETS
mmetsp:Transcript_12862/g.24255  ORF Transcript_12862/g.24255 Transcript_12862/m.24255 type:complete len:332 (-) Transcript_12862:40-1035(-)